MDLPLIQEGDESRIPVSSIHNDESYPWIKVLPIALVIGFNTFFFAFILSFLLSYKLDLFQYIIDNNGVYVMIIIDIIFTLLLVIIAVFLSHKYEYIQGTGIPPLILFLYSGHKWKEQLYRFRMVLLKSVALLCSALAQLSLGILAPQIHLGAALADSVDRAVNKVMKKRANDESYNYSVDVTNSTDVPESKKRSLSTKRNVVMMGATAGFAGVFNSPIGAMMYCIEEIATHWDIRNHMQIGAQTFVIAALTSFLTNSLISVADGERKTVEYPSLVLTDDGESVGDSRAFNYVDIVGFIVITLVCGVVAGISTRLSTYFRNLRSTEKRLCVLLRDAACVSLLTSVTLSAIPLTLGSGSCRNLPADEQDMTYIQYTCNSGEYHQLATLCLSPTVLQLLLSRTEYEMGLLPLVIFFICYFFLSNITRILRVPQGPFGPNLIVGCLIGRIVGEAAQVLDTGERSVSSPGLYALLGAGCMLGAWTRTMVAVVTVLLELSGDIGMTSPLILGVIGSRYISTLIADYSFTHEAFYELVDGYRQADEPKILHPNDWKPDISVSVMGLSYSAHGENYLSRQALTSAVDGGPPRLANTSDSMSSRFSHYQQRNDSNSEI